MGGGCRAGVRSTKADWQASTRGCKMMYVYILQSLAKAETFYVGVTDDLKDRVKEHNAGEVSHTSKFLPWKVKNYFAFDDKKKAHAFERYLKSGSGRAFAKRHF